MDIKENTIGYTENAHCDDCATTPEVKEYWESLSGQPYGEPQRTPTMMYSIGFEADELLVTYAALRTYLRGLVSQDNEDFEQIQRVTGLLIALRPYAVKASKEVSLKAGRVDSRSNPA